MADGNAHCNWICTRMDNRHVNNVCSYDIPAMGGAIVINWIIENAILLGMCAVGIATIITMLWDSYKYPVCPKCLHNKRTSRRSGKRFCFTHGYF